MVNGCLSLDPAPIIQPHPLTLAISFFAPGSSDCPKNEVERRRWSLQRLRRNFRNSKVADRRGENGDLTRVNHMKSHKTHITRIQINHTLGQTKADVENPKDFLGTWYRRMQFLGWYQWILGYRLYNIIVWTWILRYTLVNRCVLGTHRWTYITY